MSKKQKLPIWSPIFLISTILGIGKIPFAPGTLGSIVAALEFLFYAYILNFISIPTYLIYLIIIFPISLYCIDRYLKTTSKHDPSEVIIDEYVGQYFAQIMGLIICYKYVTINSDLMLIMVILSLVFFRIFDITKPSLVGYYDRLNSSFGVLMDDVVAGIISGAITSAITIFLANIYF